MVDGMVDGEAEFPERLPVNALALRFQLDHERHTAEWAAWALEQVRGWRSTTDAGRWSWRAALAD
jgi:hypothetical protein